MARRLPKHVSGQEKRLSTSQNHPEEAIAAAEELSRRVLTPCRQRFESTLVPRGIPKELIQEAQAVGRQDFALFHSSW